MALKNATTTAAATTTTTAAAAAAAAATTTTTTTTTTTHTHTPDILDPLSVLIMVRLLPLLAHLLIYHLIVFPGLCYAIFIRLMHLNFKTSPDISPRRTLDRASSTSKTKVGSASTTMTQRSPSSWPQLCEFTLRCAA